MRSSRETGFLTAAGLVVFLLAQGYASPDVKPAASLWASSPIVIDGQENDWPPGGRSTDGKTGAEFAFLNDGRNLYGLVILKDPETGDSLIAGGMMVLGRVERTKKPRRGVRFFPMDLPSDGFIAWQESQGAVLSAPEKDEIRKTALHKIFLAFVVDEKGRTYGPIRPRPGADVPDFCVAAGKKGTVCEFRIPLASPQAVPGGFAAGPGETVRISFDWGGTSKKELSVKAGNQSQSSASGYVSGTGRTWGQEFQDMFDPMSRQSSGGKRYAFTVDVRLAEAGGNSLPGRP